MVGIATLESLVCVCKCKHRIEDTVDDYTYMFPRSEVGMMKCCLLVVARLLIEEGG